MKKILLSEAQYQDLLEEKLYINIYDISFITLCELNRYWKEFAFDIICELIRVDDCEVFYNSSFNLQNINCELLSHIKNCYKEIIEEDELNIDFKDYVEINDYVTLKEWLKYTNHFIEQNNIGIFLWIED